jgi:hypothetical protein
MRFVVHVEGDTHVDKMYGTGVEALSLVDISSINQVQQVGVLENGKAKRSLYIGSWGPHIGVIRRLYGGLVAPLPDKVSEMHQSGDDGAVEVLYASHDAVGAPQDQYTSDNFGIRSGGSNVISLSPRHSFEFASANWDALTTPIEEHFQSVVNKVVNGEKHWGGKGRRASCDLDAADKQRFTNIVLRLYRRALKVRASKNALRVAMKQTIAWLENEIENPSVSGALSREASSSTNVPTQEGYRQFLEKRVSCLKGISAHWFDKASLVSHTLARKPDISDAVFDAVLNGNERAADTLTELIANVKGAPSQGTLSGHFKELYRRQIKTFLQKTPASSVSPDFTNVPAPVPGHVVVDNSSLALSSEFVGYSVSVAEIQPGEGNSCVPMDDIRDDRTCNDISIVQGVQDDAEHPRSGPPSEGSLAGPGKRNSRDGASVSTAKRFKPHRERAFGGKTLQDYSDSPELDDTFKW